MPSKESDLLKGVLPILNDNNLRNDINYDEIIRELSNDNKINTTIDPVVNFRDQLKSYAEKLKLPFGDSVENAGTNKQSPDRNQSISAIMRGSAQQNGRNSGRNSSNSRFDNYRGDNVNYDDHHNYDSDSSSGSSGSGNSEYSRNENERKQHDNYSESSDEKDDEFPGFDYSKHGFSSKSPVDMRYGPGESSYSGNSELKMRTEEEKKHNQVRSVIKDMGGNESNDMIDLEPASREDDKTIMLEEIDFLWATLEEEDAPGLERMTKPTENDSYEKIWAFLRRLRLKNDRQRYTSFADEFILWGADALEELFDGKRTYFGRYRPDLRGWRKEVQVKLRRMKHDTSTLVSHAMSDYNIGPGMRIFLELVPNAFMYARRKKTNYGKPNVFNANSDISEAIHNIREME